MGNRFEITEEMMRNAKSYIPLNAKEYIAHTSAPGCIKRIFDYDFNRGENGGYLEEKDDLPTTMPIYGEDTAYRSRIVMGTVMRFYFDIDIGPNINIPNEDYDMYAGSHVMNQIERFKANPELKSKAFDMLTDIRDFERRLNCAIYSLLQLKNDVGSRVMTTLGAMMSQEALEGIIRNVNNAEQAITAEKAKEDQFIESLKTDGGEKQ